MGCSSTWGGKAREKRDAWSWSLRLYKGSKFDNMTIAVTIGSAHEHESSIGVFHSEAILPNLDRLKNYADYISTLLWDYERRRLHEP